MGQKKPTCECDGMAERAIGLLNRLEVLPRAVDVELSLHLGGKFCLDGQRGGKQRPESSVLLLNAVQILRVPDERCN